MERQYFYVSMTGISEDEVQEELGEFLNNLVEKHKGFGATVLGMTKEAAVKIEEMLNE